MVFDPTYPHNLPLLPPNTNLSNKIFADLLIEARAEIGELNGYCSSLPNQFLLLSPAMIKESLESSKVENINTTIINVLQNQLVPEIERRTPDKEVLRYRDAVNVGLGSLKDYSLSTRTILNIQETLIPVSQSQYRDTQNGIENTLTKEIIYIPPVHTKIPELMGNLENYMNGITGMDPLIGCAISHYQFEAIHPFSDGNGRVGRILMVLYLVEKKLLNFPVLYISGYINKNKGEYYRLLLNVTKNNNWTEYITFMLRAFCFQARETKELLFEITSLYYEFKDSLRVKHKSIYSRDLLDALFSFPIITPVRLSSELGVYHATASKYLVELKNSGLLSDVKHGRYHFFANKRLVKLLYG